MPDQPRLIEDAEALEEAVDRFREAPRYAIDTEFHRERTYYPQLALVQLADDQGTVLIDPLKVDVAPLRKVLDRDALAVAHAAEQDLEVLEQACGAVPQRLLDTQVAAAFVGMTTPSLTDLVHRVTGTRIPKGNRLTDWLRRPLTDDQLRYAAADVLHLLEVADAVGELLEEVGRDKWVMEECELVRSKARGGMPPEDAWRRLKETRSLRGAARSIARDLAAWREQRAASVDRPVRQILPDMAISTIAQQPPKDMSQLLQRRGVDRRHVGGGAGEQILAVVSEALERPPPDDPEPPRHDVDRRLRPAVGLVSSWISQLGRDIAIAPLMLATRADIEALLRDDDDARLAHGWRAEVVGEPVRRLVAGEVALAFEGSNGRLVLEERSGNPVVVDLPVPHADWLSRS